MPLRDQGHFVIATCLFTYGFMRVSTKKTAMMRMAIARLINIYASWRFYF